MNAQQMLFQYENFLTHSSWILFSIAPFLAVLTIFIMSSASFDTPASKRILAAIIPVRPNPPRQCTNTFFRSANWFITIELISSCQRLSSASVGTPASTIGK